MLLKSAASIVAGVVLASIAAPMVHAQTSGLGLNPGKAEVEINPGTEKTIGFRIESPPSDVAVRGRLLLSPTDWSLDEQGTASYSDPGTHSDSASSWILFSPSAASISSGQTQLVRVTVKVPAETKSGVYRTGIFVQERPPATPPSTGEHLVFFRFRYVFTLYVIVPPVAGQGQLLDVAMNRDKDGIHLVYDMSNMGSRHVRPRLTWSIRNGQTEISAVKNLESTVLLPFSKLTASPVIAHDLPPGKYEINAEVDFHDGRPIQAVKRMVDIPGSTQVATGTSPMEHQE